MIWIVLGKYMYPIARTQMYMITRHLDISQDRDTPMLPSFPDVGSSRLTAISAYNWPHPHNSVSFKRTHKPVQQSYSEP
jgi:hypothetical protein